MKKKQRLIIVEDERIEAEAVKVCLNSRGYDVVASVATGEEAVEQAERLLPDLILMDIMLKGEMDGIQAAEQIRKKFKSPIVYFTAYTDDSTLQRVKKTAPHGFIIKPFEENELIGVVETALYKHQIEKKLEESEQRFRTFFENEPEYCYMISPQSKILDVNNAALKVLGYQKKELIGQHTKIITAPESATNIKDMFSKWDKTQVLKNVEMKIISKKGNKRDVLLSVSPVKDNLNNTIYSVGVQNDITERKQAEQALHRRDKILEAVSFAAGKFLKASSWKNDIQDVLQRLGIATGVSRIYIFENHTDENGNLLTSQRYEWIGENIEAQIDNPDLQNFPLKEYGFNRWIKEMTKGDIIYGLVKKFPKSEKEVLQAQDIQSILVAPIFAENVWWGFIGFDECSFEREWAQTEIDVLKTAADTLGAAIQRRKTEKYLAESEKRYRQLVDKAPDIIYETDETGRFTYINPEGLRISGFSENELIGKSFLDFISPKFRKTAERFYSLQVTRKKQNTYLEFPAIKKDGTEIYFGQNAQLIMENDKIIGMQAVARDITERMVAQALLKTQRDLALALNKAPGLDGTLKLCLHAAIQVSGIDSGGIYLIDEFTEEIDLVVHEGFKPGFVKAISHYDADSANAKIVKAGKPVYTQLPKFDLVESKKILKEKLCAIAIIPISYENNLIACLNVASHQYSELSKTTRSALEAIANQIGGAIIRAKMTQAFQQSRKNLQTLFDSVEDFLFVLDMQGNILQVNPVVVQRLGYSENELIGESVLKVHPPERHKEAQRIINEIIVGKTLVCPVPLITKDGIEIPVETRITLGRWDGQEVIFGVTRDITEHKKFEKQLQSAKQDWEDIFQAINDPTYILNTQFEITAVNKAAIKEMELKDKDIVGKTCFEVIHKTNEPPVFCPAKELFDSKSFKIVEKEIEVNDRTLYVTCTPVSNELGEIVRIIHSSKDITDQVKAKKDLEESENRYAMAVRSGNVGIWDINLKTNEIYLEPHLKKMLGYEDHEIKNHLDDWVPKVYKEDEPMVMEEFQRHLEGKTDEYVCTHRMIHKDGSIRWFQARGKAIFDENGNAYRVLGTDNDITERKRALDALQESEQKYRLLSENMTDVVFMQDMNLNITYASPSIKYLLGYSVEEILDLKMEDILTEDSLKHAKAYFQKCTALAREKKDFNIPIIEFEYVRKDGSTFWGDCKVSFLRDSLDQIVGSQGLIRDISERKKTEHHIAGLNHLMEDLLGPGILEEKMKRITDGVVNIFSVDFARIWMIKAGDLCESGCFHAKVKQRPHLCRFQDLCLRLIASSGRYSHIDGEVHRRVPFGCYKIGRIAAAEESKFLTNNVTADPRVHDHKWAKKLGLVSFGGYRLLASDGKPLGVLALFSKHLISPNEDALLESLANTTAQVIQTAKTEQDIRRLNEELEDRVAERTAELKMSEERATIQYKSVPVPTFTWRKVEDDFEFVNYNEAAIDFTQGLIVEYLGMKASKMYANDPQIRKELAECFTKKTTIEREMEYQLLDTTFKKQLLVKYAFAPPDSVLVHAEDISERKKAEEALQQSERQLSIRNKISNIFLTSADDKLFDELLQVVLKETKSKHGYFGYIDENQALVCPSITRDIWDECQVPDKDIVFPRDSWGGIWGQSLIKKKTLYSNGPFKTPKGHITMSRVLLVPIIHRTKIIGQIAVGNKEKDYSKKGVEFLETIATHIAPILHGRLKIGREEKVRLRAEDALRESDEKLRSTISSIDDLVFSLDKDGVFIDYYQPDKTDELYVPPDVFLGNNFKTVLPPNKAELLQKAITEVINTNNVQQFDYDMEISGTEMWFNAKISPRKDSAGEFDGVTIVSRNITERKQDEQKIKQTSDELRKLVNLMAGRENRMADLKKAIKKLRKQLEEAGIKPALDDALLAETLE